MLCDIDNFKYYNDNYDHRVGDNLLKEFYYALRDTFGEGCVYRYGGDEFLIVAIDLSAEGFELKAHEARELLERVSIEDEKAKLTFSGGCIFGVAEDNIAFRDMLHAADENLIEAKRAGKDRIISRQKETGAETRPLKETD